MELLTIFAVGLGVVILCATLSDARKALRKRAVQRELFSKFPNSSMHISGDDLSYCVFDFDASKIVLGLWRPRGYYPNRERPYRNTYEFSDVVGMEIHVDGIPIASTRPNFQPINLGSKTHVKIISLAVHVLDRKQPIHHITFFKMGDGKKSRSASIEVQQAFAEIQKVIAQIENFEHLAELGEETIDNAPKRSKSESMASQLRDLLEMKKSGTLTDEEFNAAKTRLLSGE